MGQVVAQFFLGIPIQGENLLAVRLAKKTPSNYLLQGGDTYLEEFFLADDLFIGKTIAQEISLENLEQLRSNILTLSRSLLVYPEEPVLLSFVKQHV